MSLPPPLTEVPRATAAQLGLQAKVTCPHCWHPFAPQQVLWVAEHAELIGDQVLGQEAPMRFKPSRFTTDCKAVDARGMAATRLACPNCHLIVPRQLLDCPPLFVSIIGVPTSGKSYFLTSMVWNLRQQMPTRFATAFTDADPAANQTLLDYEKTLFMQDDADRPVELEKTKEQGAHYDNVNLGGHNLTLPRPFMFLVKPTDAHPNAHVPNAAEMLHRVVCLYDNAGESFLPGSDKSGSPVTQHLGNAQFLIFLFDPTQDPRFRARLGKGVESTNRLAGVQRQETVLTESAARVRRQIGLVDGSRHKRPLVVIVPKLDVWEHLLERPVGDEPFIKDGSARGIDAVDVARVERVSARVRLLLSVLCPELVAAAEQFCERVTYVPVSAMGTSPVKNEATGFLGFRPAEIKPRWVTVPWLYGLAKYTKGLIGGAGATPPPTPPAGPGGPPPIPPVFLQTPRGLA